jgi:hypothetical protein
VELTPRELELLEECVQFCLGDNEFSEDKEKELNDLDDRLRQEMKQ